MVLQQGTYHVAALRSESVDALRVDPSGVYADLTLGGGGHSHAILARLGESGRLLCFDQDADALGHAPDDPRVVLVQSNFRHLRRWLDFYGIASLDGVLADLGVSSHHLDARERGFTFREEGPLDMRMSQLGALTAERVLSDYAEEELSSLFSRYGEVPRSGLLARSIVSIRGRSPLRTTSDLRRVVEATFPRERELHKLLAKVFQALRIEVNGELEALSALLAQLEEGVRVGGRVAIISYHSLEDRLVKSFFRNQGEETHEDLLYGRRGGAFRAVGSKSIVPSAEEVLSNPRVRSARLRVGERQ